MCEPVCRFSLKVCSGFGAMSGHETSRKRGIGVFAQIQASLNADEDFRKEFLADPVGLLKKQGVPMTQEMRNSLRAFSRQAKRKPSFLGIIRSDPG